MKDNFYRAFEEKYRGSRENIKKRQEIYLPFILPLHKNSPEGMVFDIGCGRGEWLELMREHDIPAKGVDLDEGMLEAGLSLELDMVKGDGVAFLRNAEDESAIAITSFHVVEHISFDQLQDLVSEAHRVLKPGGVLILETPNPENIRVASETFYLDPTHTKPIPSGLLSFVTQYYGYSRSKVVRLQELEFLKVQKYVNIAHLLENVSPDYAVVAQKGADKKTVSLIDKPFAQEYGISLAEMVEKFERRMIRFEELVDKSIKKVATAEEFAWKAEIQAAQANESALHAESLISRAEKSAEQTWVHYQMLVNSRSWKITKPLRVMTETARDIKTLIKRAIKKFLKISLIGIRRFPKIEKTLSNLLNRFPRLKQKLKRLSKQSDPLYGSEEKIKIDTPQFLSTTSKKVSSDLKKAIDQKGKEK